MRDAMERCNGAMQWSDAPSAARCDGDIRDAICDNRVAKFSIQQLKGAVLVDTIYVDFLFTEFKWCHVFFACTFMKTFTPSPTGAVQIFCSDKYRISAHKSLFDWTASLLHQRLEGHDKVYLK